MYLGVFMGWVNPENLAKSTQKIQKNGLGWVIVWVTGYGF